MKKVLFVVAAFLACSTVCLKAQVTIGSDIEPTKAALLDLKTQQANASNITSNKGGLLLPRVQLSDLTTFEPFIDRLSAEWINQASRDSLCRVLKGLMVYNIGTGLVPGSGLSEGVLVWTGAKWEKAGATAWLQPVLTQTQASDAHATTSDSVIATAARVSIGSKTYVAKKFSQLELVSTTGGLRLPQIENETQRNGIEALFKRGTIVDEAAAGLVIFNKESGCIEYWDGNEWATITKPSKAILHKAYLQPDTVITITGAGDFENGEGGIELNFGTIKIPENGSYVFTVDLSGIMQTPSTITQLPFYLSLWKSDTNYTNRQNNLKDIQRVDMSIAVQYNTVLNRYTTSVTMGAYFEKNDIVKIKIARSTHPVLEQQYSGTVHQWFLLGASSGAAVATKVRWWRL